MKKQRVMHPGGIAILSTPSMEYMARDAFEEIARYIRKSQLNFQVVRFTKFSRGEVLPQITENVRGRHVYLFYDFNGDACHDAFALSLTISAIQDSGAERITLILPFIPFFRQDRKDRSRVPISAKAIIDMMESYRRVTRVVTLDMHADQTQIGFRNPSDHLPGHTIFVPWIRERFKNRLNRIVIVGPDAGSEKRVSSIAGRIGCERAFFSKKRDHTGCTIQEIHGADIAGKICILNDDIIDTGGTIIQAAHALIAKGAKEVIITATHAVFGKKDGVSAYKKLRQAGFEVVVTDSLKTKEKQWLTVLPLARYMAHVVIQNNIPHGSVSTIIREGLPE